MSHTISPDRLAHLQALASRYHTAEAAITEAAALRATLSLPKGLVHVVSDIHGEDAKLRHVINNASGALRQLVDSIAGGKLDASERARFLAVLYYPREALNLYSREIVASGRRPEWVYQTLSIQFEVVRHLRRLHRREHFERLIPKGVPRALHRAWDGRAPRVHQGDARRAGPVRPRLGRGAGGGTAHSKSDVR
ncbi:MAG: fructose-bisphosphatase class III [Planctomycetota bacterium]